MPSRRHRPPRRRSRALHGARLALALACLGRATVAWADPEETRIEALIAENASAQALPLARERARRLATDVVAWERVLTIAGWNSDDAAALEALRALVTLRPDDRDRRLGLAQRLLWARATREAAPHARWLLARADERDPTALEVAAWVLQGAGDHDGARAAAARWAATGATGGRWHLADMTHWSARWREARAQYDILVGIPAERARAEERRERLRRDHPDEVRLSGTRWSDNVGITYESLALSGTAQLPRRLVLEPRVEGGRWLSENTTPAELGVVTAQARLRAELWDGVWPELTLGVEVDTAGNVAPLGAVGVRLAVDGWLFGRIWAQHDLHRVSIEAARRDIRAIGPGWSLYAEPRPWLFVAFEGAAHWLSDGNFRGRGVLAVGARNRGAFQVEPRAFAQYDVYEQARTDAQPYFTPDDPWSVGGDVTLRYVRGDTIRLEAGMGVIYQGGVVAWRPSASAQVELVRHLRLLASGGYVGSPQYNQVRVDAAVAWLF
ncbi:MAG: hypothetical protein U0325_02370 [Polyangiales bacterium]